MEITCHIGSVTMCHLPPGSVRDFPAFTPAKTGVKVDILDTHRLKSNNANQT